MKYISHFIVGIVFGIALTKGEVISWYRIYEMFHLESFHMYGIIGSAVVLGAIFVQIAKKLKLKSKKGVPLTFNEFPPGWKSYLIGGSIFGLGWALIGVCPAPMYILIGNGYLIILVALASAMLGAFVYGLLKKKLPH